MHIIPTPDYEATDFHIPYVCSYSPLLRWAVKHDGRSLRKFIEPALEDVAGNDEIAQALQQSCVIPGGLSYREVAIGPAPGRPPALKCLIAWLADKKVWIIFAEGGMEDFWEERWQAMGHE